MLGETFDAKDTAAEIPLDGSHRAVGGAVVQEIDLDALIDQVADDVFDDVRFVVRGDDRDNREVRGHGRQAKFYGNGRRIAGLRLPVGPASRMSQTAQ